MSRYSDLCFRYICWHSFLKDSSLYQLVRHSFIRLFCCLHLTVIRIELFLQQSLNSNIANINYLKWWVGQQIVTSSDLLPLTKSVHFSLRAISLIIFGISISLSTLRKLVSFGSPMSKTIFNSKFIKNYKLSKSIPSPLGPPASVSGSTVLSEWSLICEEWMLRVWDDSWGPISEKLVDEKRQTNLL